MSDKEQKKVEELENIRRATFNLLEDLEKERKELSVEKAKDEAILASVADGCIAVNENGEIILINQMAEKMLGYTNQESIGKQWYEILQREDESGNPISPEKGAIRAALSTTTTTTTTSFYYLRKDGTKFPVSRTVSPITLQGKIIGAVNIFRDITKEKEVDKAKTEFVSLASHQLRTPLTGIEWTIELFSKKEKLTKEGQKYLADIHFSASRLSALVRLLLNVSRIESGNVGVSPEPLELVGLVNLYMRECQALCDKKKLSFIFTAHPEKLEATTDKNLLGFILQNIIGNAIEYTPPQGRVEIVLETHSASSGQEKGEVALFTVKDTGIGIPQAEQTRIFEKFVRASNAISVKPDGTGLGLYIVLESVKLLGGKIWFESEEDQGSVFFVELPLVAQPRLGEKGVVLLNQKDKV